MAGKSSSRTPWRNLLAGKDYRFSDHGTHDLKGFEEPARLFEVGWRT